MNFEQNILDAVEVHTLIPEQNDCMEMWGT